MSFHPSFWNENECQLIYSRYSSEVDVDFVRKSIKAIGQTAVKIESAAERCVNVLLDLIGTRVSYVVQEAVVVMKVRGVCITLCLIIMAISGHIPEISFNIRGCYTYIMCKSRRVGRTRSKSIVNMDHWRIRAKD